MRLIIQFDSSPLTFPVNYHYLVQGWIYSMLPEDGYCQFLHNEGYQVGNQKFKLFVFSDLVGKYKVHGRSITFPQGCQLEIGSQFEEFIEYLYQFLLQNNRILLGTQQAVIKSIKLEDLPYFSGKREMVIKTISPVTAYRTMDKRVEYFSPESDEFYQACVNNLKKKFAACNLEISPDFSIKEVRSAKKRLIRFKQTFYVSYLCVFTIETDYPTFEMIWNTGLSAKSSAGFGMITVVRNQGQKRPRKIVDLDKN